MMVSVIISRKTLITVTTILLSGWLCASALADDLYQFNTWSNLASDQKASEIGDTILVHVIQQAEARNAARQTRGKNSSIGSDINISNTYETAKFDFGRSFDGRGEIRRSESLLTHLSVVVTDKLPNGNLVINGRQDIKINKEITTINLEGEVRPSDIAGDNSIFSHHIANARIEYDGSGFVTKGTTPGLIDRIFNFLGLI